ncbi:hypothetical protein Tco_0724371 [Tanacetum coccineum]
MNQNRTVFDIDEETDAFYLQKAVEYHEWLIQQEAQPRLTRTPIFRDREDAERRLRADYFDDHYSEGSPVPQCTVVRGCPCGDESNVDGEGLYDILCGVGLSVFPKTQCVRPSASVASSNERLQIPEMPTAPNVCPSAIGKCPLLSLSIIFHKENYKTPKQKPKHHTTLTYQQTEKTDPRHH